MSYVYVGYRYYNGPDFKFILELIVGLNTIWSSNAVFMCFLGMLSDSYKRVLFFDRLDKLTELC